MIARIFGMRCWLVVCLALCLVGTVQADEGQVYQINLPAQPVAEALTRLSEQTGVSVFFPYALVKNLEANPVIGRYTLPEALDLLLKGTGLAGGLSEKEVLIVSLEESRTLKEWGGTIYPESSDIEKGNGVSTKQGKNTMAKSQNLFTKLAVILLTGGSALTASGPASAQALEEVVVTAQRREQSLQEVPISIEVISGDALVREGFRNMDDVAKFSPSISIINGQREQNITIRGIGTTGNNLGFEQAAPIFLDGVHLGRAAMIKSAFLDLERVEVLRGPQPVFFGQNASAGAFSLIPRKPGPEWEGDVTAEIGNQGRRSIEGGFGGPVTDTLGIRLAGKFDESTGHMRDIWTNDPFPNRSDKNFRATLQWTPTDNLTATFSFQYMDLNQGAFGASLCEVDQFLDVDADGFIINPQESDVVTGNVAVFNEAFGKPAPLPKKCFTNVGHKHTPNPLMPAPPVGLTQGSTRIGMLNIGTIGPTVTRPSWTFQGEGIREKSSAYEVIDSKNYTLNLNYTADNGISLESITAYVDFFHEYSRENANTSRGPFMSNMQNYPQLWDRWSQELRVRSASGGMIEWEAGAYWQEEDLDMHPINVWANLERPIRYNHMSGDSRWLSAFGNLTFNFLDGKASLSAGGRYTDVKKSGTTRQYGGTWIFDVDPTPGTPAGGCVPPPGVRSEFCIANNRVVDLGGGLWTHRWRTRGVPDVWNGLAPVGYTALTPENVTEQTGGYITDISTDNFDPQVTLHYRPSDDMTLYTKWARAFKAGGYTFGSGNLIAEDAFTFDDEKAETFEVGARGTTLDGRLRYDATLFQSVMNDLQLETSQVVPGGSVFVTTDFITTNTNAGKQRVRGLELNLTYAATDRLTTGLAVTLMDGVMLEYTGAGCNEYEVINEDTGPCISAAESLALVGHEALAGTIDRSGTESPWTPDWAFVVDVDYWLPVADRYKATFNGKFLASDGYINDAELYYEHIVMESHADINLSLGFGDMNDVWRVSLYGRNLLEAKPTFHQEFASFLPGVLVHEMGQKFFRSYGVQFQYNYN